MANRVSFGDAVNALRGLPRDARRGKPDRWFHPRRVHPRFGDRVQELVIVAHQALPDELTSTLHAALLTDDELAEGKEAWLRYPDPLVAIE